MPKLTKQQAARKARTYARLLAALADDNGVELDAYHAVIAASHALEAAAVLIEYQGGN